MNSWKKSFCVGLCLALSASLAACSQEEDAASGSSLPSTPTPSAVSSTLESEGPESSQFIPSEDLIPSQPAEEGEEAFHELFSQNPIDQKYNADYAAAVSFSMMRQACDEAAESWKAMALTAYQKAASTVSGDELSQLQSRQDLWERETEQQVSKLREDAGSDPGAMLNAARQIVLLYRGRAEELSKIVYSATGGLPSFEAFANTEG